MMATGYYGGHGTAAAVGQAYEALGWSEATDLAYTTATVGIVGGIILGIIIINWGARKNYTNYVRSPKDLPVSMKTGLIPRAEQSTSTTGTISTICADPMAFHLALVLVPSILGYALSKYLAPIIGVEIPAFCTALLFGFIMNFCLNKTGGDKYVDRASINRISGTSTDFLMISGIGALKTGAFYYLRRRLNHQLDLVFSNREIFFRQRLVRTQHDGVGACMRCCRHRCYASKNCRSGAEVERY